VAFESLHDVLRIDAVLRKFLLRLRDDDLFFLIADALDLRYRRKSAQGGFNALGVILQFTIAIAV
jgi:hypothetical protein